MNTDREEGAHMESIPQFSKGPFTLETEADYEEDDGAEPLIITGILDADGKRVVAFDGSPTNENAHLMKASAQMYAALDVALHYLVNCSDAYPLCEMISRTMADARGEEVQL